MVSIVKVVDFLRLLLPGKSEKGERFSSILVRQITKRSQQSCGLGGNMSGSHWRQQRGLQLVYETRETRRWIHLLLRALVLPNDDVLDRKVRQSAHSDEVNNW